MDEALDIQVESFADGLQILTFVLDGDWFGVEIECIQEVLEYRDVTPVPRTPNFMLGVINLRGKVIPVVDLRRQFDMEVIEPTIDTCIVILYVDIDGESTPLGVLADKVQEVLELRPDDIAPPPRLGNRIRSDFIAGMARQNDHFIIILYLARVFSMDELQKVIEGSDQQPTQHWSQDEQE